MSVNGDRSFPHLILASASPRRRAAIGHLGLIPSVVPAEIDEVIRSGERPDTAAVRLAATKAAATAPMTHAPG
ncbi:MAG TPA: Maf family protein [Dehalococcoidia bacterium]|nr:Maf family protein [Dehalococcoidia bacterium]